MYRATTSIKIQFWPEGYKIIVFDAEDHGLGSWNHGFSYGVAISEERNEIVYWAEDW